ncbi:hypothetical protein GBZ26_11255 [Azospirillum formosense]|uniref:Uncharacterized protein n=1 Tax=Azospirillum formosense TaxID=861533 RepID=A0ABX2KVY1_9PROT|nr:hypothetical protein [Azospirillum formosense]MBY3756708.1 hypothetical protein [Azospirillum formosense]NUB19788.1 hypothetical protein [Azospirillum formosense]
MPEPPLQPDAQQVADKALADCGGERDAALLLLAHLLINARRGMSPGFLRLGPPNTRSIP